MKTKDQLDIQVCSICRDARVKLDETKWSGWMKSDTTQIESLRKLYQVVATYVLCSDHSQPLTRERTA